MKLDKNNNISFLVQDSKCVTNIDEEYFYDTLDDKYIKDSGEVDINLLQKTINKIKKILENTDKLKDKCEQELKPNTNKQRLLLFYHGNSLKKLDIFHKQKTSKIFQFKSKLINFFTWGGYNCEAKRINKIVCENVNIRNQKAELKKIGLKILQLDNRLDKIKKAKKEQLDKIDFLEHWYNVGKEVNLRNQSSTSSDNPYLDKEQGALANTNIDSINSGDFFPVQHDVLSHCTIL